MEALTGRSPSASGSRVKDGDDAFVEHSEAFCEFSGMGGRAGEESGRDTFAPCVDGIPTLADPPLDLTGVYRSRILEAQ